MVGFLIGVKRGVFHLITLKQGGEKLFVCVNLFFKCPIQYFRYFLVLFTQKRSSENVQLLQTDTVSDDLLFIMVKFCINYDKSV